MPCGHSVRFPTAFSLKSSVLAIRTNPSSFFPSRLTQQDKVVAKVVPPPETPRPDFPERAKKIWGEQPPGKPLSAVPKRDPPLVCLLHSSVSELVAPESGRR